VTGRGDDKYAYHVGTAMSQIRKAHSVEIIDRRLSQYQSADAIDPMELIELHDELSRVERKWLDKAARHRAGEKDVRPLPNAEEHNARFERLKNLFDATLRRDTSDSPERRLLQSVSDRLHVRQPVKP
jgi:hypothetical protein